MQTDQLKYLVELHKTHSMTKAAENLYVSQPAISKSLSNLEKELGVKLFNSSHAGISFTKEGNEIVARTQRLLYEMNEYTQDIKNYIQAVNKNIKGELSIGVNPSLMQSVFPKIVSRFVHNYPNVHVRITKISLADTYKPLDREKFDMVFVTWDEEKLQKHPQINLLEKYLICNLVVCIAMDANHPLCNKISLTLNDIVSYPWIGSTLSGLDADVDDYFFIKNRPDTVLYSDDINIAFETLLGTNYLVAASNLCEAHPYVKNHSLLLKPFKNNFSIKIGTLYYKDSPKKELIDLFSKSINLV